ncbi:unnamed protein product [Ambrosiozyma monospora]|uniref:Unnamed protein product n=1 Tax=Ambrosiozyma monospora TaxID=43982 RepID=A0ACB5T4E5_AMBMO|nr:unnamed protein product [Ambrosiozyma monospora]
MSSSESKSSNLMSEVSLRAGSSQNGNGYNDPELQEKESCQTHSIHNRHAHSYNDGTRDDVSNLNPVGVEDDSQILHGPRLIMCILSTCLCLFLMALDQTITAAIISEVSAKFKSFDEITWITAGFFLGTGALCQIWGQASSIWGRKWIMLLGVFIFEIGSLICALSQSMKVFIVGRVIQGMGGANIETVAILICTEVSTMELRPMVFAMVSLDFTIATVLGPIIGGLFATYVSWRWCFYINLCFGGIIVPVFFISFNPKTPKGTFKEKMKKLDCIGSFFMISSIVITLIATSLGVSDFSWNSGPVIVCFILGGLLAIAFLIWNFKYSSCPLIRKSIVGIPQISFAAGSLSFGYSAYTVSLQFLSIYFQVVKGDDSIRTGLSLLPIIISCALASLLVSVIIAKTGHVKVFSISSALLLCIGSGLLVLLHIKESFSRHVGLLIITGIGCGLVFQPALMSAQMLAPDEENGLIMTNSYMYFGQNIGIALNSQISQVIYSETLKSNLASVANSGKISEYAPSFDLVTLADNTGLLQSFSESDQLIIKGAFIKSLHNTFYFSIALSAVALLCACFMSDIKFSTNKDNELVVETQERKR